MWDKFFIIGKPKNAIKICDKWINQQPQSIVPYKIKADLYSHQGMVKEAIESYKNLLELHEKCYVFYPEIRSAYLQAGDYDNALKGLDISSYAHKYTEEHAVFTIQKYQFVSLLKDDLFKDIAVYFKNPIDEDKKVVYNELTYYENSKKKWVLGESSLFTFR